MLADGPIAYWRLGETSGTTAVDATGNGYTGTYSGGITLGVAGALTGDTDPAAGFDGVSGMVQVPDSAPLRLNGTWSIEFWAKQDSFVNGSPGILGKGNPATTAGYDIWADATGALWFKHGKKQAGSGSGSLTSAYRYFVATYDSTRTLRWYVDGALATTTRINLPNNNSTSPLQLGNGDFFGHNDLDEVALYVTALNATQVAAHYAAGS